MSGFPQAYTDSVLRALFQPIHKFGKFPVVLEYASPNTPAWPEYTEKFAPLPTPPLRVNADETLRDALDLSVSLGLFPQTPSFSEDIEAGLRESQYADTLSPSSDSASYDDDSLLRVNTIDSDQSQRHPLRPQDLLLPDDFEDQGKEPTGSGSLSSFRFPDYSGSPVVYGPFSAVPSNADPQYRAMTSRPEDLLLTLDHVDNDYSTECSASSRCPSTVSQYLPRTIEPVGLGIHIPRTRTSSPTQRPTTPKSRCPSESSTFTTTLTFSSPILGPLIPQGSPQTPNTLNIMNERDPAFLRSLEAIRSVDRLGDGASNGQNGAALRRQSTVPNITRAASVMENEEARETAGQERSDGGKKRYLNFIDRSTGREGSR